MPTYTVRDINSSEQKTTKAGKPFTKFLLSLVGEDGPVPYADFSGQGVNPGDTIDGEIKDEGFGRELRKAGSGTAKPKSFRSPAETKAIQRQHSQEMALRWTAIQVARGLVPDGFDYEGLKPVIDWFERDIG